MKYAIGLELLESVGCDQSLILNRFSTVIRPQGPTLAKIASRSARSAAVKFHTQVSKRSAAVHVQPSSWPPCRTTDVHFLGGLNAIVIGPVLLDAHGGGDQEVVGRLRRSCAVARTPWSFRDSNSHVDSRSINVSAAVWRPHLDRPTFPRAHRSIPCRLEAEPFGFLWRDQGVDHPAPVSQRIRYQQMPVHVRKFFYPTSAPGFVRAPGFVHAQFRISAVGAAFLFFFADGVATRAAARAALRFAWWTGQPPRAAASSSSCPPHAVYSPL